MKKRPCIAVEEQREGALPRPNWRLYKNRQRARKKQEKEMPSTKSVAVLPNTIRRPFVNRTAQKQAVNAAKENLPSSPRQKVAVVAALVSSPRTDHLPLQHSCCIHDYSENYSCTSQDQLQS